MIQAARQTSFASRSGGIIPLDRMQVTGTLKNAFAILELVHVYRNDEPVNIEAVYSFPLPVEATLLHLSVKLNDTVLIGRVAERSVAEAEYEDAVAAGDTAVMLEQVEPGFYTVNVGNLMARETAEIRLRYAVPLKWDRRTIRLAIPTTIAPRFGDHRAAGIPDHQAPITDDAVEHRYALNLQLLGRLGNTNVSSPSHAIAVGKSEDGLEVSLPRGFASADRDFVLTLEAREGAYSEGSASTEGDRRIVHTAFFVPDHQAKPRPITLKVLVDCSGSMAGDSIALAKAGALHALNSLRTGDQFSVSAFGDQVLHDPGSKGRLQSGDADSAVLRASRFVEQLDADLGGTQMLGALEGAFGISSARGHQNEEGADVLLITDGEVWDRDDIVAACRASAHRIFVIGIGSSPTELVVREVAEATGGAAAFVSPNEPITPVIERHLQRMRHPRVSKAEISWPGRLVWQTPARLDELVFPGDTLHVFAELDTDVDEPVQLSVRYSDGSELRAVAEITRESGGSSDTADLPRIAAATRIRQTVFKSGNDQKTALTELAVRYQVVSPYTNYILVHSRGDDAATDIPELKQVPNMLAAGWGGFGSVLRCSTSVTYNHVNSMKLGASRSEVLDIPAFLRASETDDLPVISPMRRPMFGTQAVTSPAEVIKALNATFPFFHAERQLITTVNGFDGLLDLRVPIPEPVLEGLQQLIREGETDEQVTLAFWLALLRSGLSVHFSRAHRRAISRASKAVPVQSALIDKIAAALAATTDEQWDWATAASTVNA